jgi:hypothetical protein
MRHGNVRVSNESKTSWLFFLLLMPPGRPAGLSHHLRWATREDAERLFLYDGGGRYSHFTPPPHRDRFSGA